MKRILAALALTLAPCLASADGDHLFMNGEKVFSCITSEGREISVTVYNEDENFIVYQYGFLDRPPELRLDSNFNPALIRPWGGEPAMMIYEEAVFANVDHTYTVYKEYHLETHEWSAGVVVKQEGKTLGVVQCEPDYINTSAFAFEDVLQSGYTLFWFEPG